MGRASRNAASSRVWMGARSQGYVVLTLQPGACSSHRLAGDIPNQCPFSTSFRTFLTAPFRSSCRFRLLTWRLLKLRNPASQASQRRLQTHRRCLRTSRTWSAAKPERYEGALANSDGICVTSRACLRESASSGTMGARGSTSCAQPFSFSLINACKIAAYSKPYTLNPGPKALSLLTCF